MKKLMAILALSVLAITMSGCGSADAADKAFVANTDKPVNTLERFELLDIKDSIKGSSEINPERKKVLLSAIDSFL